MNTNLETHTHTQWCGMIRSRCTYMVGWLSVLCIMLLLWFLLFFYFPHFLYLPPTAELADSFWVEKSTNHLCNNSFYEFVPSCRKHSMVSRVSIAVCDSLMWAERLPCWLSTPSQAHLQGPQRLWGEAYHQCSCCLITFFSRSLLPPNISGCLSHSHSVPKPSFIYLSLF